jgi:poly(3-hydroxyalkanoate) synthetase
MLLSVDTAMMADASNICSATQRSPINDLMAWNTDATRMPYTAHSEYLRHLFLRSSLCRALRSRRPRGGLTHIAIPIFGWNQRPGTSP